MRDSDMNRISSFKKISVERFRRLCEVELELRPLTVLIGANGTGKTSLLDVFSLWQARRKALLIRQSATFLGCQH